MGAQDSSDCMRRVSVPLAIMEVEPITSGVVPADCLLQGIDQATVGTSTVRLSHQLFRHWIVPCDVPLSTCGYAVRWHAYGKHYQPYLPTEPIMMTATRGEALIRGREQEVRMMRKQYKDTSDVPATTTSARAAFRTTRRGLLMIRLQDSQEASVEHRAHTCGRNPYGTRHAAAVRAMRLVRGRSL
jgi:hypothetical protein